MRRAPALTLGAAVIVVLVVRQVAVRILHPDPAFTPAQHRFSSRCHCRLHHHGHLRLRRTGVLTEPGPNLASGIGGTPDSVVCAVPGIADFAHHGEPGPRPSLS